jgi:predicted ester cyclase
MTTALTQENKKIVWDFWQELTNTTSDSIADVIQSYVREDISWNGPRPINQLKGVGALVSGFWLPLLQSFPDIKRQSYIFFGGQSNGRADGQFDGEEWVCGTGYFTGTFQQDWLAIPATGSEMNIRWGEFCRMREGRIVEIFLLLDVVDVMQQAGFHILPPSRGADGWWPPPRESDGILLTAQDEQETQQSLDLIKTFIFDGLNSFDQSELESMGMAQFFHPQVQWYGPGGIGGCRSFKEFEDFHQRHWLRAFPDRQVQDLDALFAEGRYMGASGWAGVRATHTGEYLDCPATGNKINFNGLDFWKREGDLLVENWVFVDMIDVFRQFGIDLFERLRKSDFHRRSR